MRVFWALIAVLVLGAAVVAARSVGGRAERAERVSQAEGADPATQRPQDAAPPRPAAASAADTAAVAIDPPAAPPQAPDVPVDQPAAAEGAAPAPEAAAPQPAPEVKSEPAKAAADAPLPAELEKLVAEAIGDGAAPAPAPASASAAEPAKPMVVEQPDGSKLVAGRFILKGEGTKAKPYEVPWDMLVAAQETYKPRLGQKTLPPYLEMLNGKFVTVGGFVAFPLMAQSADEMLVMLNQWDGCCIGIPPTPYDAVEVRLKSAAEGETRFKVSGSVTGKFAVDPYLVKDWLIGLYTMEDAELTTN